MWASNHVNPHQLYRQTHFVETVISLDDGRGLSAVSALFFSLHNTETGEYLEGPPAGNRPLAERFFRTLSEETSFAPTRPLSYADTTTTPGMAGRMTVVQGLYRDFQIPAFLMEQRISYNEKLGHLPEVSDRIAFGGQLVRAVAKAILTTQPE